MTVQADTVEIDATPSPDRPALEATSSPDRKRTRSRVSNGHAVLPNVNGRSAMARRFKDIANAILADQAGPD